MVSLIARGLNELRIAIDLRTCHRNEIHAVVPHKGLIGERHSLVKLLECGIDNAVVESFACAGLEILRSYAPAAKVEVAVSFTPKLYVNAGTPARSRITLRLVIALALSPRAA